jgi:hypothetical protein
LLLWWRQHRRRRWKNGRQLLFQLRQSHFMISSFRHGRPSFRFGRLPRCFGRSGSLFGILQTILLLLDGNP